MSTVSETWSVFLFRPLPDFSLWVRIKSTRSPGKTKPAIPVVALIGTETARMPGVSTAAMKPREPDLTMRPSVIGSPAGMPRRTTAPTSSLIVRLPLTR